MGDVKPVGEGVYEMREFIGAGWRMYYTLRGNVGAFPLEVLIGIAAHLDREVRLELATT